MTEFFLIASVLLFIGIKIRPSGEKLDNKFNVYVMLGLILFLTTPNNNPLFILFRTGSLSTFNYQEYFSIIAIITVFVVFLSINLGFDKVSSYLKFIAIDLVLVTFIILCMMDLKKDYDSFLLNLNYKQWNVIFAFIESLYILFLIRDELKYYNIFVKIIIFIVSSMGLTYILNEYVVGVANYLGDLVKVPI